MTHPMRYLYLLGQDKIYLTTSTRQWIKKRYRICFDLEINLSAIQNKKDIPYLYSLYALLREEVWHGQIDNQTKRT